MKYKQLIKTKLENLEISIHSIDSLLSQRTFTKEDYERVKDRMKTLIAEITTLLNSEADNTNY